MLLMFAEGFANLGWMAALAVVMVGETTSQRGSRLVAAAGAALLSLSIATVMGGLIGPA